MSACYWIVAAWLSTALGITVILSAGALFGRRVRALDVCDEAARCEGDVVGEVVVPVLREVKAA